jgi:hypothetical protein
MRSARILLEREYSHADGQTLLHGDGQFYRWVGSHYKEISDDVLKSVFPGRKDRPSCCQAVSVNPCPATYSEMRRRYCAITAGT